MRIDDIEISVCALTCNTCPILRLPNDENAGKEVLEWYQSQGWYKADQTVSDIIEKGDYCNGCKSIRNEMHWSPECTLLVCCIDKKHLDNCSQCEDFPCGDYKKWMDEGTHHKKAYANIVRLKKGKSPKPINF